MLLIAKFFSLIRWKNLCIVLFTQYAARLFLVGRGEHLWASLTDRAQLLISLSTILVAASGYIINDYFDIKIDQVNKPDEVIIGRYIPRRYAILAHQSLNITAAVISFTLGWKVFVINILAMTLLWFYASIFKKMPFVGNFLVAALTGASLVVMAVYYPENDLLINIYAVFAFGITLIREIIKDIEDIRGDKKYGSKTLPIIWGLRKTKLLLYIFMLGFVCTVIAMGLALGNTHLNMAFIFLSIPFGYIAVRLYFADRKSHFSALSSWTKAVIILGIMSMVFV
ncbi:geranylgeranylglycerol-phosphate geranylgeranyltransferase [Marinilongibacter aquaticus]|uniref:geranylgeranylglycerol-phosphate geranylgeranyltransferase n=1 Tax=Marinilongibacter aquaticus TaxID=2975157 RepID=UPI0021BD8963|nr:geranylgeranylglycerol-phosphate geranylgeranyltransferase [Marinilongibacter aquaticus]UBM59913.1 geranylgeranylglycerol-phosphate geranylgeranyltransferase [Marinilongibacter aquaticus]